MKHRISIIKRFLKDPVTLKPGVMTITGMNYILKYTEIDNSFFISNNSSQYYSFYCIFFK